MRLYVLLLGLMVGACGTSYPTLSSIQRECGYYDARPFDQAWPCIKAGVQVYPDRDLWDQFAALGDLMVERVRTGRLTEVEAKAIMAEARVRLNNALEARYTAPQRVGVICNKVGTAVVCI